MSNEQLLTNDSTGGGTGCIEGMGSDVKAEGARDQKVSVLREIDGDGVEYGEVTLMMEGKGTTKVVL